MIGSILTSHAFILVLLCYSSIIVIILKYGPIYGQAKKKNLSFYV